MRRTNRHFGGETFKPNRPRNVCLNPAVKQVENLRLMDDPLREVLREVLIIPGPFEVFTDEVHLLQTKHDGYYTCTETLEPKFYTETDTQILVFTIPEKKLELEHDANPVHSQDWSRFTGRFICKNILSNFSHHSGLTRTRLLDVIPKTSLKGQDLLAGKLSESNKPPIVNASGLMWTLGLACRDNTAAIEKARKWVASGRECFFQPRSTANNLAFYQVNPNSIANNKNNRNDLETTFFLQNNADLVFDYKLTDLSLSFIAAIVVHSVWIKSLDQYRKVVTDELRLLEMCVAFQERYYNRYASSDTLSFEFDSKIPVNLYNCQNDRLNHPGTKYYRSDDMVLDDPINLVIASNGKYIPFHSNQSLQIQNRSR
jgi:hypothetical protein